MCTSEKDPLPKEIQFIWSIIRQESEINRRLEFVRNRTDINTSTEKSIHVQICIWNLIVSIQYEFMSKGSFIKENKEVNWRCMRMVLYSSCQVTNWHPLLLTFSTIIWYSCRKVKFLVSLYLVMSIEFLVKWKSLDVEVAVAILTHFPLRIQI